MLLASLRLCPVCGLGSYLFGTRLAVQFGSAPVVDFRILQWNEGADAR